MAAKQSQFQGCINSGVLGVIWWGPTFEYFSIRLFLFMLPDYKILKRLYRVAEKSPYTQTIRASDSIQVYTAQRSTQYSVKW
jgi:hypothetical protein